MISATRRNGIEEWDRERGPSETVFEPRPAGLRDRRRGNSKHKGWRLEVWACRSGAHACVVGTWWARSRVAGEVGPQHDGLDFI